MIEGEEVKKYYLKLIDEHWTRYVTKTDVRKYLLFAKYEKQLTFCWEREQVRLYWISAVETEY